MLHLKFMKTFDTAFKDDDDDDDDDAGPSAAAGSCVQELGMFMWYT